MCTADRVRCGPGAIVRFIGIAAACLVLLIGTIGCGGTNSTGAAPITPAPTDIYAGAIAGTVFGSGTALVAGALVETTNRQALTASNGTYLLTNIGEGNYRVTVRATGFTTQARDNIPVHPGEITRPIDFYMTTGMATPTPDFGILALSPRIGTDGDEIDVLGHGFGSVPGQVTIGLRPVSIMVWTDSLIRIKIPDLVETGVVKVVINGISSHETSEVVFVARPIALECVPAAARPGTVVEIVGRNFHPVRTYNRVTLNSVNVDVLEGSTPSRLRVMMPANTESGIFQVRLETPEYQADGISSALITIPPSLIHLSPKRSLPDVTLTLYGNNFGSDPTAVRVIIGNNYTLGPNDFISFSTHRVQFKAPPYAVLAAGQSAQIRLSVNNATTSESITYTAYNPVDANLTSYGIRNITDINATRQIRIARFRPYERLALVMMLEGAPNQDLPGSYTYTLSSILGNNRVPVPALPQGMSIRGNAVGPRALTPPRPLFNRSGWRPRDIGPLIRAGYAAQSQRSTDTVLGLDDLDLFAPSRRAALADPAPASTTFWVVNPYAPDANNTIYDRLASATLMATGTYCLIYTDPATNAATISSGTLATITMTFDRIYNTLATACWDGVTLAPVEGNVDPQPRIVLFITPKLNQDATGDLRVLGLFHPRDKNPASPHSNGTEILYLDDQSVNDNFADFMGTCAHEFSHMIYDNQKARWGVGSTWVNEGLAMWSQDVVGYGFQQAMTTPSDQVGAYLRNAYNVSINHWPADSGLENYGGDYLFVKYLHQMCGGQQAIRLLERNNGATGLNDIESFVMPLGTATRTLAGFNGLFAYFSMALYCDNLGLKNSLSGYKPFEFQFTGTGRGDGGIGLRGAIDGINGLSHYSFGENPVQSTGNRMVGYSAEVLEWPGGNDGDLEIGINPSGSGNTQIYVVYWSTKDE